jgi:hypothetical protein
MEHESPSKDEGSQGKDMFYWDVIAIDLGDT